MPIHLAFRPDQTAGVPFASISSTVIVSVAVIRRQQFGKSRGWGRAMEPPKAQQGSNLSANRAASDLDRRRQSLPIARDQRRTVVL